MAADSYADEAKIEAHIASNLAVINGGAAPRQPITATPYQWIEPSSIPPREWLYNAHYIRKFLSGTVAPGGLGKSSNELVEAVAMASGKPLLGAKVRDPLRVWHWNGEDPLEELQRRVAAICLHYRITKEDLGGRLFLNSGRQSRIVVATESRDGAIIAIPVIADLKATIGDNGIDVFQFDPFVSCHSVSENDNGAIGDVLEALAEVADVTNSAGDVVHHVRKNRPTGEVTVDDGRGAAAFLDRVRSARSLNRMSKEEAVELDISVEDSRSLFRIDRGKGNLMPPAVGASWRRFVSVPLGNGTVLHPEDEVGVVTYWEPVPGGIFHGITADRTLEVQQAISRGMWRLDSRTNRERWAGTCVAEVLGLNGLEGAVHGRLKEMLRIWIKNGVLAVNTRPDENRKARQFVEVGRWVIP